MTTRKPYTNQEAFDVAARHMLTQGRMSARDDGTCQYRGPGGLKCAVGALIDDADYMPGMDVNGSPVSLLAEKGLLPEYLKSVAPDLLLQLQRTHDGVYGDGVDAWPHRLRNVALRFGLSPAVIDEVRS